MFFFTPLGPCHNPNPDHPYYTPYPCHAPLPVQKPLLVISLTLVPTPTSCYFSIRRARDTILFSYVDQVESPRPSKGIANRLPMTSVLSQLGLVDIWFHGSNYEKVQIGGTALFSFLFLFFLLYATSCLPSCT